jgi:hypothetical protein
MLIRPTFPGEPCGHHDEDIVIETKPRATTSAVFGSAMD